MAAASVLCTFTRVVRRFGVSTTLPGVLIAASRLLYSTRIHGVHCAVPLNATLCSSAQDWVVLCGWPVERIAGNWQRAPQVAGRLRLCTRSLFFEPDDVRVPIVR